VALAGPYQLTPDGCSVAPALSDFIKNIAILINGLSEPSASSWKIVTTTSSHTWLRLGEFRRKQPAYLKRNFFIGSQPLRPRWSAEVGIKEA